MGHLRTTALHALYHEIREDMMPSRPKVFVSRAIPQAAIDLLNRDTDLELNEKDKPLGKGELIRRIQGKEGLVCLITDIVDDEVLASNALLKVVSNVAVGYDNINVRSATERRIMVTNTPEVLTETTADLTRAGKFKEWSISMLLGHDVYGKTVGICGLGRIGRAVAKRARGFDMKVLYTDVVRADQEVERGLGARFVDKDTLLGESDFVTLHMPLVEDTVHYISQRELRLMKPTAHLINASRGPVVDEQALVRALREKWIAGAGLDVYEHEPTLTPGLADLENIVLLPHIGSASIETRTNMAVTAARNCIAALRGKRPPHLVNPEAL
jgi:lactate dehydrogenase-like 2-hydroxyacid dehydrogenase